MTEDRKALVLKVATNLLHMDQRDNYHPETNLSEAGNPQHYLRLAEEALNALDRFGKAAMRAGE